MLLYSKTLLEEESSIHTVEMTAMKKIKEREDIRWVTYIDSLGSILAIKNNREKPGKTAHTM